MLLGLLTAWLGNAGAWTPENQKQFDTKIFPSERMIQAFHQRGEAGLESAALTIISRVAVDARAFHVALEKVNTFSANWRSQMRSE